jgi:hypothetical protein
MLGQASPISTWSWISVDIVWEVFARRLDSVATCPDATQCSRIFRVSFTDAEMSDSEHPDVVLLSEESHYSGKAVVEDPPNKANFRPKTTQPKFEFV